MTNRLALARFSRHLLPAVIAAAVVHPGQSNADAKAGEQKAQLCLLCHKPDRPIAYELVPTLEGQTREYLIAQIDAYKEKRRANTAMQTNTMTLSKQDIADLADYFSSQKPLRVKFKLDPARVDRGKELTEQHKCGACHGAAYAGNKDAPRLAGMEPRYSAWQLMEFSQRKRSHSAAPAISLTHSDAAGIAEFLAGLEE
jgi:cytochrome c553